MRWDDVHLCLTIARSGSLARAARILEVHHSTVYRRLEALEAALGEAIFLREAGYTPTPFGEELLEHAQAMEAAKRALDHTLSGPRDAPSGRVVLTAPESILPLLVEALASFRGAFPAVEVCGRFEDRFLDLTIREADVAVRFAQGPPEALIARRVARVAWCIYTSAHELARLEEPPDELPWARYTEALSHLEAERWRQAHAGASTVVMSASSVPAMGLLLEGTGCRGLLPCFVGDARSALVRLGEPIEAAASALWVLYHPDLKRTRRVKALVDHLFEALGARSDLLEGRSPHGES